MTTTSGEISYLTGSSSDESTSSLSTTQNQSELAFLQMEQAFQRQAAMCTCYKLAYERQCTFSMTRELEAYKEFSLIDLKILRQAWHAYKKLPKFKFYTISLYCRPCNVDLVENEVEVSIRTYLMPIELKYNIYAVASYGGPTTRGEQPLGCVIGNFVEEFARNPHKSSASLFGGSLQLDKIKATRLRPFWDMRGLLTSFNRPIKFMLDQKGKFRVIKLTFYETMLDGGPDRELGSAAVKLDCLNKKASKTLRLPISKNSIDTGGGVEVRLRVRRPFQDTAVRHFQEHLLVLT